MAIISYFWRGICFVAHVCYQRKDKHLKIFFLCYIMRNLQKKPQYYMANPISAQSPPHPLLHCSNYGVSLNYEWFQ